MGYYIDLEPISIDDYKEILRSAILIPSWMILKDNIDENLDAIKTGGPTNLQELKTALKNKEKVLEFAALTGLDENYLMVLRRVVNGLHPKPNRIKDFPGISSEVAGKLETIGIKNTFQLYDHILTQAKREALEHATGLDTEIIIKLAKLTDLSRVRWVNHTFANVLLEAGYDSAKKVAKADSQVMYKDITDINKDKSLYKGNIGAHDLQMCIEAAKTLDQ